MPKPEKEDEGMFTLKQVRDVGEEAAKRFGAKGHLPTGVGYLAAGTAVLVDHFGEGTLVDKAIDVDG